MPGKHKKSYVLHYSVVNHVFSSNTRKVVNLNRKSSNNIPLQVIQDGALISEDDGDNVISILLRENFTEEEVRRVILSQKNIKNVMCVPLFLQYYSELVSLLL